MKWLIVLCICSLLQKTAFGDSKPNKPIDIGNFRVELYQFRPNYGAVLRQIYNAQYTPVNGGEILKAFFLSAGRKTNERIIGNFEKFSQEILDSDKLSNDEKNKFLLDYQKVVDDTLTSVNAYVDTNKDEVDKIMKESMDSRKMLNEIRVELMKLMTTQNTAVIPLKSLPKRTNEELNLKYGPVEAIEKEINEKLK